MVEVLSFLKDAGHIDLVQARHLPNPLPSHFRSDLVCAYHSDQRGHTTEQCRSLKHKVQDLIDAGVASSIDSAPPYEFEEPSVIIPRMGKEDYDGEST